MKVVFEGAGTGRTYAFSSARWLGDEGELLNLKAEGRFDPSALRSRSYGLWRYREMLPLENPEHPVTLGESITPITTTSHFGGRNLFLKHDYLFPSGSYKDRGAAVMMSRLKEWGVKSVVQDSSGNAGASVSMYAAAAGIECSIFVPEDTEPAKLLQVMASGATLVKVPGTRADTAAAALLAAKETTYASHCYQPLFFHGTKTIAYELAEQFGWKAPDHLILPAGNGTLLLGAYLGFSELAQMGIIGKMPKIHAVQSAACRPLFLRWKNPDEPLQNYVPEPTLAEGIAIGNPVRLNQMLEVIHHTKGMVFTVSDEQLKSSWKVAASHGIYVEPTSATVLSAAIQLFPHLHGDESVVAVLTGSGLKTGAKIASMLNQK